MVRQLTRLIIFKENIDGVIVKTMEASFNQLLTALTEASKSLVPALKTVLIFMATSMEVFARFLRDAVTHI